uniref:phage tail fiber protein n=1 Tax=Paenibacillus ehimensis TaxID=79264 RepID=UPI00046EB276
VYIALYTSDPMAADTGQEVSGGAYARKAATFTAAVLEGGKQTIKNSADIEFPVATADWGTVTHIGIRDAATGGNLLYFGALTAPRTILSGDRFKLLTNSLVLTLR